MCLLNMYLPSALYSMRSNEGDDDDGNDCLLLMENAQSRSRGLSRRCPFQDLMALPGLDEGCDKLGCRINLELLRYRRTAYSQGTISAF